MTKIIDLSHEVTHQMAVFPADPAVGILNHHNYQNGYFVNQIIMGTHTGTHLDVPVHKISGGKSLSDMPIDRFCADAYVIDLTYKKPNDEISIEDLKEYADKLKECSAVIFHTGWSKYIGQKEFFTSFPGLNEEVPGWLVKNDIRLIGLETPSVHPRKHELIHTLLLEHEIVIVEALNNVDQINNKYVEFFAMPLNLKGLDGSPVRAFAIDKD